MVVYSDVSNNICYQSYIPFPTKMHGKASSLSYMQVDTWKDYLDQLKMIVSIIILNYCWGFKNGDMEDFTFPMSNKFLINLLT